MMMKVKGEMQVNEIEIFDGRRLCSDKLSFDLLPSRFICCTCYILQTIWYFAHVEILPRLLPKSIPTARRHRF